MLTPDLSVPPPGNDLDNASLVDGFFSQLREKPSDTALLDQNGAWSYHELSRAAATVARALMSLDAPEASTCLVVADRSRHSVAAAFGALMAGWRYCLVDRDYPAEKLEPVIDRLQPGAVVDCTAEMSGADTPISAGLPRLRITDLIGAEGKLTAEVSEDEIEGWSARLGRGNDVAFYTFTSGTTGTPKVLAMSHAAYNDVIQRLIVDYEFSASDRIAVQSGFMFDAIWDVLTALNSGGAAVILPDVLYEDGRAWARYLRHHRVTSLMTVPAALQYALETMPRGQPMPPFRQVILTADRISCYVLELILRHLPEDITIHNCYGVAEVPYLLTGRVDPTQPETASLFELPDPGRVDYRLVPITEPSSAEPEPFQAGADREENATSPIKHEFGSFLTVRGKGVFSGYVRETADGTVARDAPFSKDGYYDTGDIFRIVPHATVPGRRALRFVGRHDRRLTWMGHRIEPEEIETAAEAIPGVEHAVASITTDARLVCTVYGDVNEADFVGFQPISSIPADIILIEARSPQLKNRKVR